MIEEIISVKKQKQSVTKSPSKINKQSSVLRSDCFSLMDESGRVAKEKDPNIDPKLLLKMYEAILRVRLFDERGMMLQRQGRIGFYVPSTGQEAIQIGTAAALEKQDWAFPSYREPGVFMYKGASLYHMLCNLYGNKGDICRGRQMPVHYSFAELKLFSVSSPIATQVIQAVGAAVASKLLGKNEVAITYFGDGGTSENDFHSGLTFGGAQKAPVVFICTNNQYAISVPFHKQTGAQKIVDKAIGYGVQGVSVDGNDILAVHKVTQQAVQDARLGLGPTLIECVTLRMGPHSSSDDPTRYRDEKLFENWKKRDPILRFKTYLTDRKILTEGQHEKIETKIKEEIADAVIRAEAMGPPEFEDLFDDVFLQMTPQLKKQKEALLNERSLRDKFENTSEAFPL